MIIERRCRKLIYRELKDDEYYLRRMPKNIVNNFIDIGANVGLISIFIKFLNPNANVLAIEPHPKIYNDLVSNVAGLGIKTKQVALGNGEPFYLFKERKTDLCNSFIDVKTDGPAIQSQTLNQIVEESKFPTKDLYLKIDCEGAERFILNDDLTRKLLKDLPFLVLELHPKNGTSPKEEYTKFHEMLHLTHIETNIHHSDKTINLIYIKKEIYSKL